MKEVSKYSLIFLSVLILLPGAVSLAHVFSGHHHKFCNHYAESHIHKNDLECKLLKFHKTPYPQINIFRLQILNPEPETSITITSYGFLSEFQKLGFGLRAPPALI